MAATKNKAEQEVQRLEEVAHELALILNNTTNSSQINRIQRDLDYFSNHYFEITGNDLSDFIVRNELGEGEENRPTHKYITKIRIERASEHCEDHELNLISSIIKEFELHYWIVLSDKHTKLDFSHTSERDSYYTKLEELKRNLRLISQNIEEIATSPSQEYVTRLKSIHVKQKRMLLLEYGEFFTSIRDFLGKLVADIERHGTMVMNKDEEIHYETMDGEPYFAGKKIGSIVIIVYEFCKEAQSAIRLPDF